MKLPIVNTQNSKVGEQALPAQFNEEYRPDLILRAVLALQSRARQAYGSDPKAGMRHSVDVSKRRRDYKTSYGFGISRVARKVMSRRGTRMNWVGAQTPQTRGGRRTHPPKLQKIWEQKINLKENRKALRSALAATVDKAIVQQRGHKIPAHYPFLIDNTFESLTKTTAVEQVLCSLGFELELARSAIKKVRAGKGKYRGRKYERRKGLLIVVSGEVPVIAAARNVPGIDIVPVKSLNAELLAPGALPGRATLWTEKAIQLLEKEKLFN